MSLVRLSDAGASSLSVSLLRNNGKPGRATTRSAWSRCRRWCRTRISKPVPTENRMPLTNGFLNRIRFTSNCAHRAARCRAPGGSYPETWRQSTHPPPGPGRSSAAPGPFRGGRRFNVVANEPAAEPARRDLVDDRGRLAVKGMADGRQVHVIGHTQMVEALAHAPFARSWLPVELRRREPGDEPRRPLIGVVDFGEQPASPRRVRSHD